MNFSDGTWFTLKFLKIIIIVIVVLPIISFFYEKQLGAIPFLLIAIYFLYYGWKIWRQDP